MCAVGNDLVDQKRILCQNKDSQEHVAECASNESCIGNTFADNITMAQTLLCVEGKI